MDIFPSPRAPAMQDDHHAGHAYPTLALHAQGAERNALWATPSREEGQGSEEGEQHSRTSQRSDDSFSAYIEDPVRQSTPPLRAHHHHGAPSDVLGASQEWSWQSSSAMEAADLDEQDASLSSIGSQRQCDEEESERDSPHGSIVIPDLLDQDDDDGDLDAGEKKRRRRTNKAEANVLASVFAQTQFPDAHTREALAQRLNMKAKAVSIWFQNRRQAMKKRASRFGGVEGVNGPTLMATSARMTGDIPRHTQGQMVPLEKDRERLRRWTSLDDVASMHRKNAGPPPTVVPMAAEVAASEQKRSAAPILDFICRHRGENQLSRMASMPSLAAVMGEDRKRAKSVGPRKDLRDFLPPTAPPRPELHRSSSASSLLVRCRDDQPWMPTLVTQSKPSEHSVTLQMSHDGRATLQSSSSIGQPAKEDAGRLVGANASLPALLAQALQRKTGGVPRRGIWERMESSSSSNDGHSSSPDSNKENRDPAQAGHEDEDEEQTLKRIAGKRAERDLAKKEERLSKKGMRYVLEADARVALQQRQRPLPLRERGREWNRAASDAQVLAKNTTMLSRVPSLDMTAGRDRLREAPFPPIPETRAASKRPQQDENAVPTLQNKRSRHESWRPSARRAGGHSGVSVGAARSSQAIVRRFQPSLSMPTVKTTSLSSRLGSFFPMLPASKHFESTRESSARLDGANTQHLQSLPGSQTSSENGSDDWLEAWAQERSRGARSRTSVLTDRSALLNIDPRAAATAATKHPVARHDDSGFYGSESGADDDGDDQRYQAGQATKRRSHLISQDTSSPIKRGDERDRLAAETLLGLGSQS